MRRTGETAYQQLGICPTCDHVTDNCTCPYIPTTDNANAQQAPSMVRAERICVGPKVYMVLTGFLASAWEGKSVRELQEALAFINEARR